MKVEKKYIGIMFFILVFCSGYAQNTGFYWTQLTDSSNRLQGKLMGKVYYITAQANSHFLYPNEWCTGTVTLTDGDSYQNLKLRHHVYRDELIAYNENNNALYFVEKELVKSFELNEGNVKKFFLHLKKDEGSKKQQFFEVMYSGDIKLLAFRYIYEHKVSPYNDKMGIMRDTEYRMKMDYYVYSGSGYPQKILPKRSAFIKAFPSHKKEIKKLFRKNNLIIRDQYTMLHAFQVLDRAGIFLP